MTLNIALLIKANAAQAKAEVTSLATVTKTFGTQTRNAGNDTRQAAAAMAAYEARIASMEAELRLLIATQGAANDKARQTVPAFNGGAQSVGNMAAQFNDIGVMLAAGQNPLQLAIQQGTQIGQVFGGKGIGGALGMVKAGFLQMVSPVNLATIGIIAMGGIAVQWLTAMAGGAEEAADKTETVEDAARGVADVLGKMRAFDFTGMFSGMRADAVIIKAEFNDILAVIERVQQTRLTVALDDLREQLGVAQAIAQYQQEASLLAQIGSDAPAFDALGLDTLNEAKFVLTAIKEIEGQTREEILASVEATTEKLYLRGVLTAEVQNYLALVAEEVGLADVINEKIDEQAKITGTVKSELGGVLGLMVAIGSTDMSGPFARAEAYANRLYARVGDLLGRMMRMAQQAAAVGGGRGIGRQGPELDPYGFRAQLAADAANAASDTPGTGGGGGGGGAAARAERDAVAELIAKLREEAAVLAELDPVKAQMLRYREQLSTATAAEQAEVEALIVVREREKAMDQLGEVGANSVVDLLKTIRREGESASDVFKKMINNLVDMGIEALILGKGPLAQLFGISGNIFQGGGGGGGGGWLGSLVSGLFGGGGGGTGTLGLPAFADGVIFGAGGGRDDKILARVSAGESIINARATARHRPLLERINAGLPRFANGMVGGGAQGGAAAAGGGDMTINVNVTGARGNSEILDLVHHGVAKGLEIYRREALPADVIRISRNPHERGR